MLIVLIDNETAQLPPPPPDLDELYQVPSSIAAVDDALPPPPPPDDSFYDQPPPPQPVEEKGNIKQIFHCIFTENCFHLIFSWLFMIGHYENVKACSHLNVISIENKLIDLKLLIAHFINIAYRI